MKQRTFATTWATTAPSVEKCGFERAIYRHSDLLYLLSLSSPAWKMTIGQTATRFLNITQRKLIAAAFYLYQAQKYCAVHMKKHKLRTKIMKKIAIFALAATAMLESSLVMARDQLAQALLKGLKKVATCLLRWPWGTDYEEK
ncbi:hypothetical protein [Planktomarina sp.]|uniref:hypothetical protein n=1 Tax=Planktomarina sp. TaxID=2024851 RepID=UPI00289065F2|nr:hypothetical protein [Planktomarina sp.]